MTLKTTIRSLSFVMIASASSFALAQGAGIGLGADARVGAGGAQIGTGAQAGTDMQTGAPPATKGAHDGVNTDAGISGGTTDRTTRPSVGGTVKSTTGAIDTVTGKSGTIEGASKTSGSSGKSGEVASSIAADAKADASAKPKKVNKAKQDKSSVSGSTEAGADTSVQSGTRNRN
jgi:hypothetical protein